MTITLVNRETREIVARFDTKHVEVIVGVTEMGTTEPNDHASAEHLTEDAVMKKLRKEVVEQTLRASLGLNCLEPKIEWLEGKMKELDRAAAEGVRLVKKPDVIRVEPNGRWRPCPIFNKEGSLQIGDIMHNEQTGEYGRIAEWDFTTGRHMLKMIENPVLVNRGDPVYLRSDGKMTVRTKHAGDVLIDADSFVVGSAKDPSTSMMELPKRPGDKQGNPPTPAKSRVAASIPKTTLHCFCSVHEIEGVEFVVPVRGAFAELGVAADHFFIEGSNRIDMIRDECEEWRNRRGKQIGGMGKGAHQGEILWTFACSDGYVLLEAVECDDGVKRFMPQEITDEIRDLYRTEFKFNPEEDVPVRALRVKNGVNDGLPTFVGCEARQCGDIELVKWDDNDEEGFARTALEIQKLVGRGKHKTMEYGRYFVEDVAGAEGMRHLGDVSFNLPSGARLRFVEDEDEKLHLAVMEPTPEGWNNKN
jgi:hypothetical protein